MAEPPNPNDRITLDDLAISTLWEVAPLAEG